MISRLTTNFGNHMQLPKSPSMIRPFLLVLALALSAPLPVFPISGPPLRTGLWMTQPIEGGDKAAAMEKLKSSQAVIDRIADKKIVHKNLASRTKSRLAHAIKAMA